MPASLVFALVLSLIAAGAALFCVSLVRASTPQALQIRLKEVQAMLDATQAALEAQINFSQHAETRQKPEKRSVWILNLFPLS